MAHFQGDDRPVTFQGNGILVGGQPLGNVWDVPHEYKSKKGKVFGNPSLGGTFLQVTYWSGHREVAMACLKMAQYFYPDMQGFWLPFWAQNRFGEGALMNNQNRILYP